MKKTRYVVVGTGGRSAMYIEGLSGPFADVGELAGFCDVSPARMAFYNERLVKKGQAAVPTAPPSDFEALLRAVRADRVIVTPPDRWHDHYIIRAMQAGCDVVCEKPMTIDAPRCRAILQATADTGRKLIVTFNYRYAPKCTKVKELLASGVIGRVVHVDYEWLLDTSHGADYFRRWHRRKANSGGLLVHKATHHFDMVNWCLDAAPVEVFARGSLAFYGAANGHGPDGRTDRCRTCRADCRFRLDLAANANHKALYLDAERDNPYQRDQCVFGEGIDIEDNAGLVVRFDSGATMSYGLVAFSAYEGSRIVFTGTRGRLEYANQETAFMARPDGTCELGNPPHGARIEVFPMFKPSYTVPFETVSGGHDGADTRLLADIFRGVGSDPLHHAADHFDGARGILIGIAANQSIATGEPVRIDELVPLPPKQRIR